MAQINITQPPTTFPAGGGVVEFSAAVITGDEIAQALGYASNAALTAAIGASTAAPPVTTPPAGTESTITGATINGAATPAATIDVILAAMPANGTVLLPAGTFAGTSTIPLVGTVGGAGMGKTILNSAGLRPAYEQATLVVLTSGGTVIENMTLEGAATAVITDGMNASGARAEGVDMTLNSVEITGCQNGILTTGPLTLNSCNLHDNGTDSLANGQAATHEIYAEGPTTTLTNTKLTGGVYATHALKTRSPVTTLTGCDLSTQSTDGNVSGSVIDVPDGGNFTMTGGSLTLGAGVSNQAFLNYGAESANNIAAGVATKLLGVVFDGGGIAGLIQNLTYIPTATLDVTGSTYKGTAGPPTISGFASVVGTIAAAA